MICSKNIIYMIRIALEASEEYCARDLSEAYCVRLVSIKKYAQISKTCQSIQFDDFKSFAERKKKAKRFAKLIILILIYETSSTFLMMMLRNLSVF